MPKAYDEWILLLRNIGFVLMFLAIILFLWDKMDSRDKGAGHTIGFIWSFIIAFVGVVIAVPWFFHDMTRAQLSAQNPAAWVFWGLVAVGAGVYYLLPERRN